METPTVQPQPVKKWAVIASGIISGTSNILQLREGTDIYPVIVYAHDDKGKCERRAKSLAAFNNRVKFIDAANMKPANMVIFGVVQIALPAKKPRKEMTAEEKAAQVAKMQAGRKPKAATVPAPKK